MKNEIKVGDQVACLYGTHLEIGSCIKVNKKTYGIVISAKGIYKEIKKNFEKHKVANVKDKFTVVWNCNVGAEGAYRIDYDKYPQHNDFHNKWYKPITYIIENN